MKLNDLMEIDHVIQVHEDGSITEPTEIWAPSLYDSTLDSDAWALLDGYSGQDRYSGPIMHPSEFIGGRMETDIRETPGIYVAIVDYVTDDGLGLEHEPDGWAVARLKD